MSKIVRDVFASPEQVERVIQKVIDYQHSDNAALKKEIQEYIATEHISQNLDRMLEWIELSMSGNVSEVGAWVSGFYGSGKSSFTKYFGFAFDQSTQVDNVPFVDLLADRIDSKPISQRLKTLSKRCNAAVVMLDLATQNIINKPVSDVLLLHVLQWAGFSKHAPIAEFEQLVREDGRWNEMLELCHDSLHRDWLESHDKLLIAKGLAKKLADRMYPGTSFDFDSNLEALETVEDKAKRIIRIIREKTGRENILIIIDEVGQFIGPKQELILDMQGLVQNLRTQGQGKVLVIATAQQTLLETDSKTALNSPYLVKLRDRFPMQVNLQSSDIEEICYRRLLGKSPDGETSLRELFARHGQRLISRTKLTDSIAYESPLEGERFIKFYPFLPSHFKIVLGLLGELAKGRGGYGLRSAIKVVQDVLTGGHVGGVTEDGLISHPLGTLVNGVWLFDVLQADIDAYDRTYMQTVQKTLSAYQNKSEYIKTAKVLAIVNLLPDFESSPQNIAALLQSSVEAEISEQEVASILRSMAAEPTIPVSDQADGTYHYLNEKQEQLSRERDVYTAPQSDITILTNSLFSEVFKNHSTVQPFSGLSVGVELSKLGHPAAIRHTGGEPLHLTLALADFNEDLKAKVEDAKIDSLGNPTTLYLAAKLPADFEERCIDILKSEYMFNRYSADTQARDYVKDQQAKAISNRRILEDLLRQSFSEGVLVALGTNRALNPGVDTFDTQIKDALQQQARNVFEKYQLASAPMKTGSAKFVLHAVPGKPLERSQDPLKLLDDQSIQTQLQLHPNPVIDLVVEYLEHQDETTGLVLLEHFNKAPYGWSKEVTQYILAALFAAGKIELTISGRTHSTINEAVDNVFASPKNFKNVGVRIRQDQFSTDDFLHCFSFLSNHGITTVGSQETALWNAASQFIGQSIGAIDPLSNELAKLNLYGTKELRQLQLKLDQLKNTNLRTFLTAIQANDNALEHGVLWLEKLQGAAKAGLFETIREVISLRQELDSYPEPSKQQLVEHYDNVLLPSFGLPSFTEKGADYRQFIQNVKSARQFVMEDLRNRYLADQTKAKNQVQTLAQQYGLSPEETQQLAQTIPTEPAASCGIAQIIAASNVLLRAMGTLELEAQEIHRQRPLVAPTHKTPRKVRVPMVIRDAASLQKLIDELQQLRTQIDEISEIEMQIGD